MSVWSSLHFSGGLGQIDVRCERPDPDPSSVLHLTLWTADMRAHVTITGTPAEIDALLERLRDALPLAAQVAA